MNASKDLTTREIVAFNTSDNLGVETGIKRLRKEVEKATKVNPREVADKLRQRDTLFPPDICELSEGIRGKAVDGSRGELLG